MTKLEFLVDYRISIHWASEPRERLDCCRTILMNMPFKTGFVFLIDFLNDSNWFSRIASLPTTDMPFCLNNLNPEVIQFNIFPQHSWLVRGDETGLSFG